MKSKLSMLIVLVFVIFLTSCATSPNYQTETSAESAYYYDEDDYIEYEEMPAEAMMDMESGITSVSNGTSIQERIVIKNASLSMYVADPIEALNAIQTRTEELGGFVVESNLYKTMTEEGLEVPEATISVRVPAETLDDTLEEFKNLAENSEEDILYENVSGQDVTQQYTDLQSRLTNLENTAEQLQEIMDDAFQTEDVLAVYSELVYVNEEIEILKGQIKYYDEASRLSSIDISLLSSDKNEEIKIGSWEPAGIARDAIEALLKALKFLVYVVIWLILFILPLLICMAIPVFLIYLVIRQIVKRRKAKKAEEDREEESK